MRAQSARDTERKMVTARIFCAHLLLLLISSRELPAKSQQPDLPVYLSVNASAQGRTIPSTLFGIAFEELNHAGAGGLWAELVSNRGFEAGGENTPSNIDPWSTIGDETQIHVTTDRSSCLERNPIALRIEIISDSYPPESVGVYNPGFWGMNVVAGSQYRVVFWIRSTDAIKLSVSFTSSDGLIVLAQAYLVLDYSRSQYWTKQQVILTANGTDHHGRLALTSSKKGTIWLDQVSAMPIDTYKGHGFRKDLALMLEDLKPRFLRFPGGSYVVGQWSRNSFHWQQAVGPWDERPGHFDDVWGYWTDDGIGFSEFLQLAEDLNASPVWVFNNGISFNDQVRPSLLVAFVKDVLNALEFARGPQNSKWGSVRASMGHLEPFELKYLAIGNEACGRPYYQDNYMKFYMAIKFAYPDVNIISNCDGLSKPLDHPADMFDFHVYTSATNMFKMTHQFDLVARTGPKVFVSEYQVHGNDAGNGNLLASIAEAAFLIGVERNSDIIEMASYAPLFVNNNDRRFSPDAIVFDSWQRYGTPSYWIQHFFKDSGGGSLLPILIKGRDVSSVSVASALKIFKEETGSIWLIIKVVNVGNVPLEFQFFITGIPSDAISSNSTFTIMTSNNPRDENSFSQTMKVAPVTQQLPQAGSIMNITLPAYCIAAINLQLTVDLCEVI